MVVAKHLERQQARADLDAQFAEFGPLAAYRRPTVGWIRGIRQALGMSQAELGDKLDITQSALGQLEVREVDGSATLSTMERVAEQLDCDFFYGLAPRGDRLLEQVVQDKAHAVAYAEVAPLVEAQHLDDPAVAAKRLADGIATRAAQLVTKRGLWSHHG